MAKRSLPPPSLGKPRKKKPAKKSVFEKSAEKFAEWQVMRDQIVEFERALCDRYEGTPCKHIRCFGYGAPRNFALIINCKINGRMHQKRMRRDIRDGSHQFWFEQFDTVDWTVLEF